MENNAVLKDYILTVLRERNVPIKIDELNAAIGNPDTRKWLTDHLGPETLLSKEETALYTKLEASGALRPLLQGTEISSTRPFLDSEIRTAIESLKASTIAIEKQTETLKQQCNELKSQLSNSNQVDLRQKNDLGRLHKGHGMAKQQSHAKVDDLTQTFEEKLSAALGVLAAENSDLASQVTSRLKQDDKIIESLGKLASSSQSSENDRELRLKVSKLCDELSSYIAEEVHCHLDRVYLEGLKDNVPKTLNGGPGEDEQDQLASVNEEINSLYPEIDVLSDMNAQQQLKAPILLALQSQRAEAAGNSEQQLIYILTALEELSLSSEQLAKRLQARQSHRLALNQLAATYKSELHDRRPEKPTKPKVQRRSSIRASYSASAVRGTVERRLSLSGDDSAPSLESLLRRLGISLSALLEGDSHQAACHILNEKRQRMLDTLENLHSAAESSLAPYMGAADTASQLLSSPLLVDSNFTASLSNSTHEQRLSSLESQIGVLQKGINGLNMEVLHQGDRAQGKFIERWSGE
ncbi:hypothetical protein AJ80_04616 [Polytolypa hystricis UAMH7299]|uniref:HAUS augmin-like complex subunit 3 N-terminal domain-containing protein n=1 Tax=Polytolypa hystricis (strain UAMH7299) TaxID=1447883 RepID=A0A2B7Y9S1_POLH7|nr:hypothetical protein AJ80_04616 [Polytolypa hystricis UAMH7299]